MKKLALTVVCLLFIGVAFGNHWTPVNYGDNMTLNCYVAIDGQTQSGTNLELGAFCGDECRESKYPTFFPPLNIYMYTLTIRGSENGESISFRLYDSTTEEELNLNCDYTLGFVINGTNVNLGLDNPLLINFTTPSQTQTYELPITGYGEGTGNYYLISSPIGEVSPGAVTNMIPDPNDEIGYDLFYFDQTKELEWVNIKDGQTALQPGKGYLYAREESATLTFTGTAYSGNGTFDLVYSTTNSDPIMHGWNLMGNPFATTATVNRDCYVMGEGGGEIILSGNRSVAAMQGVFVKALETETEPKVTFGQGNSTGDGAKVVLNVRKDRAATIDRAMVRFNDNSSLPKFMLDSNNTKIYIPQSGSQYAVVSSDNVNSLPVNFKARENGTYTLGIDINEVRMEYLHLLDNKTGADIDLLVQPDYQFTANNHDYEARFTLVFRAMTGIEEQIQQSFCFMNGRNLYFCEDVEGAILCLVDMTGRMVRNETLKGNGVNLSNLSEGVYVVRLNNGDNVKTQKVVVR